ncbi:MAG TPA: phosphate ABC transporter permease PstA [Actinomycetota bacterium]|nr:phosphate ABC transporter permease PstA [Actinomycetota bacterium]
MARAMQTASTRRKVVDKAMLVAMVAALVLSAVPLVSILIEVIIKGLHAIHGVSFFTQPPPGDPTSTAGGVGNAIIGTVLMVLLASVVFIPLGILGAVYLAEFAPGTRLARLVRFFAEVMTGIPSILFGVFAYGLVVVYVHHYSGLAGALALGMIMWPIVLRTTEEMLLRVPSGIREASLALGTPKWKTVLKVVLPSAGAGITTGAMLAVSRAAGETAPLLFTALDWQFMSFKITQPISSLPVAIFSGATSAYDPQVARAWGAALTLLAFVLILTLAARFVTARRSVT